MTTRNHVVDPAAQMIGHWYGEHAEGMGDGVQEDITREQHNVFHGRFLLCQAVWLLSFLRIVSQDKD